MVSEKFRLCFASTDPHSSQTGAEAQAEVSRVENIVF